MERRDGKRDLERIIEVTNLDVYATHQVNVTARPTIPYLPCKPLHIFVFLLVVIALRNR